MAALLNDYLRKAVGKRHVWGMCDCLIFPADWIVTAGHADPAAPWRGRVQTERQAMRFLRERGGIRKHVVDALARIGLVETQFPQLGDVGLVRAPVKQNGKPDRGIVGAICCGPSWAVLTGDLGVVVAPLPLVMAWRV